MVSSQLKKREGSSAYLVLGIGVLAVSTASIFAKFAQQAGASSLAIAALRLTFASLVLLPFALFRFRAELAQLTLRDFATALLSGAFLGAHFAVWFTSLEYTSVAISTVLVALSPLFTAIASVLFLKESLTRLMLVGIVVAIVGGVVVGVGDLNNAFVGANPLLGSGLAVLGALCVPPYLLIGRKLRQKLSVWAYVSVVYSAAAFILLLVVAFTRSSLQFEQPSAYFWVLCLALIPQLIGHTTLNWSLGFLPASYATIPVLAEPIGSTFLALLLLPNQAITPSIILGGVLTLVGIGLMSVRKAQ